MYSKILIVGRDSEEVMWELWSGEQGILGTEEGCQFLNVLLLFPESRGCGYLHMLPMGPDQ